ncbi:hypothetical protein [Microbacterium sp. NPDC096154]|uniref:hypothetical protein n=1 Tax=Microbacterium sp. NPDC096154 TaxID=3155549 RepID=UPI00331ADAD4
MTGQPVPRIAEAQSPVAWARTTTFPQQIRLGDVEGQVIARPVESPPAPRADNVAGRAIFTGVVALLSGTTEADRIRLRDRTLVLNVLRERGLVDGATYGEVVAMPPGAWREYDATRGS